MRPRVLAKMSIIPAKFFLGMIGGTGVIIGVSGLTDSQVMVEFMMKPD